MQDLEFPVSPEAQHPSPQSTRWVTLASQQRHLELLLHLCAYSELLVLVVGDAGAGKTTLLQQFAQSRQDSDETLQLTAEPGLALDGLISRIAAFTDHTGLSSNRSDALDQLRALLHERYRDGGALVVVIDDAENLASDALNDISYLALLLPQQLSIVLSGRTGFEQHLRSGPTSAPTHVIQLDPLSEEESSALMLAYDASLSAEQLRSNYQASSAYPADLLQHVGSRPQSPESHSTEEVAKSSGRFPLWHIVAVALIGCVTVMAFLYQGDPVEVPKKTAEEFLQVLDSVAPAEPAVAVADYNYEQNGDVLVEKKPTGVAQDVNVAVEEQDVATADEASEPSVPATTLLPQVGEGADDQTEALSAAEPDLDKTNVEKPEQAPPVSAPVTAEVAKNQLSRVPASPLLTESGYVIQVLGVKNRAAAERFVAEWQGKLSQRLYLYQTTYQNAPWFVVVVGIFTSESSARSAASSIPQGLSSGSPWVRNLDQVRPSIK
ncbi:hypothetical protein CHH28_01660 [Bacterioplanes sanyensis]|uniref:SPOR domain-containing protein n=1 Tax=Bacterioplanes sanyensis TaxID=1249553 RepID=A0A222FG39_9GAMM|nr:AAA family ATPase [Bacterioplanes sanyensis]ASP37464.1 hypothetical protein CHH28_01660 [Bacterioplanes sanyensis]